MLYGFGICGNPSWQHITLDHWSAVPFSSPVSHKQQAVGLIKQTSELSGVLLFLPASITSPLQLCFLFPQTIITFFYVVSKAKDTTCSKYFASERRLAPCVLFGMDLNSQNWKTIKLFFSKSPTDQHEMRFFIFHCMIAIKKPVSLALTQFVYDKAFRSSTRVRTIVVE